MRFSGRKTRVVYDTLRNENLMFNGELVFESYVGIRINQIPKVNLS
jgi:hypothetical protein